MGTMMRNMSFLVQLIDCLESAIAKVLCSLVWYSVVVLRLSNQTLHAYAHAVMSKWLQTTPPYEYVVVYLWI